MKTNLKPFARLILAGVLAFSAHAGAAPIFTPNNQPTGWVGEVDVSNFSFRSNVETIFKSDYIKGSWSGNLLAFPVLDDGTVQFASERWSGGAAPNVDDQDPINGRRIVTMKDTGAKIPFLWGSLSTTQQAAIDNSKSKDTIGPNIVNYIRGDRTNENPKGANYRARTTALGDIIHSRPLFVDHPTDPRVYVGGNDGMLHAFDADSGVEEFAYVPSFFIAPVAATSFSNIKALIADPYVHTYFVDASPNAANTGSQTILVGGLGAGGKGLFALDITNPVAATEADAANKILWEITPTRINWTASTDYADLGYTYGIPVITKLNDGTWAAIVGNGYNNTGGNQAVLYIINLTTGARISATAATAGVTGTSDTNANGLSSVTAVDTNRDGKADYVYAGDINGNLWKFDIRTPTAPTVTKLFTTSPAQPITGRPSVSLHPNGGYMINFATGRMFTAADATDSTTVYYAYGLWDNGTYPIDATKVVSQTLTAKTWTSSAFNYNVRVSSSNAVDYTAGTGQKTGWKLALPAGERVVGDGGLVTNSRYVFSSTNPTVAHAAVSGVAQPQGDNWLNEVDFLTGGGGTDPVFDLDANLSLGDSDRVRAATGTAAQTGPTGIPVSRYMGGGLLSQPLVAQLDVLSQTYFNVNPDVVTSAASSTDPGVSGGHFDFDIYYGLCTVGATSYKCATNVHVHEYDDKYNVTGVDMQNASLATFNLSNAIASTSTQFKILVSNQKFNPAAMLMIGGAPGVRATSYLTTAGMTMASLPTYTRAIGAANSLQTLIFALPLDAFKSKDWAGTGDVRAGLMPTQTSCVHANQGAGTSGTGPWMQGALTIQIVKASTPDSAVELNIAGDPSMGYRLKKDATSQSNQLAQYTTFWHHPNKFCYGQAGWVKNPPEDTTGSTATFTAHAPGSTDPAAGLFGTTGSTSTGGGTSTPPSAPTSTVTYYNADGSYVTQTSTYNADGSVTVTRVYSYGGTDTFVIPPSSGGRESDTRARTGRVSWREMIRP